MKRLQQLQRDGHARSPHLAADPGIEQQRIDAVLVVHGPCEVVVAAHAHGLPEADPWQRSTQLQTPFGRFVAMQLHHLMALAGPQRIEHGWFRVDHHQHPKAGGIGLTGSGKHGWPLGRRQVPWRAGHGDHADGINPQARDRRSLVRLP